jgi:hypothetical protein
MLSAIHKPMVHGSNNNAISVETIVDVIAMFSQTAQLKG